MKKILIIKHGAFGDIVLSLHAIFSIRAHFKNCEITVLTESKYTDFFRKITFIKNIKIDNRKKFYYFLFFFKFIFWFYKEKFDWVFDLQTSRRTNNYYYLFSLFSNFYWSGIAKSCSHPHLGEQRVKLHTIERHKEQLKIAGINKFKEIEWSFFYRDLSYIKLPKNYAIIVPGGSIGRPEKRWALNNFKKIMKHLFNKNIISIIIGGKDELILLDELTEETKISINLIGKTNLVDLVSLAKKAAFIIGNDTGPMHLLSASSSGSVCKIILFGSDSNPNLCAPVGNNVNIIQKKLINDINVSDVTRLIN